jgi:hypothetical protein
MADEEMAALYRIDCRRKLFFGKNGKEPCVLKGCLIAG